MPNDIYKAFGVSPNDYEYDPSTDSIRIKPDSLPTDKNTFNERFGIPVEQQPVVGNNNQFTSIENRTSSGALDALLGAGGQERFQLWPERMVRSALSAAGEVVEGKLPVDRDPITGKYYSEIDYEPNWIAKNIFGSGNFRGPAPDSVIERAQDVTGMAGMSTLGIKPGTASVGSGATRKFTEIRKSIESDSNYVYHATNAERANEIAELGKLKTHKPNEFTDQNVWPDGSIDPRNYFTKDASNTWQFAPEEGSPVLLRIKKDVHEFKKENTGDIYSKKEVPASKIEYLNDEGKWVSLLEDSKAGTGIAALNQQGMYSNLERVLANSKVEKGTPEQWQAYLKNQPGIKPEELEFSLGNLPNKQLTKAEVQNHIAENGIKLGEVWKGDLKFNKDSPYALPEVVKAAKEAGTNPGELELVLANDGNAYSALTKKFPQLGENENWAELVSKSVFGGDTMPIGTSKHHSYQLPGGENYRELLLTAEGKAVNKTFEEWLGEKYPKFNKEKYAELTPDLKEGVKATHYGEYAYELEKSKNTYKSSHWDEPNVLAHIRMNDREIPGVGKTLHIEEIQSDWHQAGRKQGYIEPLVENPPLTKEQRRELDRERIRIGNEIDELGQKWAGTPQNERGSIMDQINAKQARIDEIGASFDRYKNENANDNKVPNAPFKKTWDELALKRTLTEAVNNGYDAVSWTPGEAQALRYQNDIRQKINNVDWHNKNMGKVNENGQKQILVEGANGSEINIVIDKNGMVTGGHEELVGKPLERVLGKDIAKKILEKDEGNFDAKGYVMDSEGMKAFYDKMLVDKANSLLKKMGGKVEYEEIPKAVPYVDQFGKIKHDPIKIPIIKITPAMREKIQKEGFPLYSSGVPTFSEVDNIPNAQTEKKREPKLVPVDRIPKLTPVPYIPGQVI